MKYFLMLLGAWCLLLAPATAQPAAPPLVVATYAYNGNDRQANIGPLAAEMARCLGRTARVQSFPTVPALLAAVRAGQVDVAFLNTLGYLSLQGEAVPPVALARLQARSNDPSAYRACLVARKALGLSSLAAVGEPAAALRLVFAGQHSTSGHLVPRLLLASQGLPAETSFRELRYAGSHAAVLTELQAGRADLGACGLGEFRQLQARGQAEGLQLLWASDDIPLGPVVCRPTLPAAQQQALRELLLKAHQTQPAAFAALCRGWAEAAAASEFVPVRPYEYEAFFRVADTGDEQAHGLPGRGAELRRLLAEYVR